MKFFNGSRRITGLELAALFVQDDLFEVVKALFAADFVLLYVSDVDLLRDQLLEDRVDHVHHHASDLAFKVQPH